MPYFGFDELPPALRLFLIDKMKGRTGDLLVMFDATSRSLRWFRIGENSSEPRTGSLPLPPDLIAVAETLPRMPNQTDQVIGARFSEPHPAQDAPKP